MRTPQLRGIVPPLVTPLTPAGEFDAIGCRNLVRHVLAGGVHGILVTGSNGEVAALDEATRERAVETVMTEVAGRVPVMVGVARVALKDVHTETRRAGEAGAAAVLVAPPYYSSMDEAAVRRFYLEVADQSAVPVLIYNIPGFTKVPIAPDLVRELALAGAIVGVKDSSRDFDNLLHLLEVAREGGDFTVFTGSDSQIAGALAMGAHGAIGACGNLVPNWQVSLLDAWTRGDYPTARKWQQQLFKLVRAIRIGLPPAALKAALATLGICGEACAPPVSGLSPSQRETLSLALIQLRLTGSPTAAMA